MATVPASVEVSKAVLWVTVAATALLPTGCVTLPTMLGGKPAPKVCQVAALWQNSVLQAPDPTKNGKCNQGLAGRVLLFGPEVGFPLVADGRLIVDMYDLNNPSPEPVERWDFHPNDLAKLGKKDRFGWGYTVFLPSARLTPAMTRVKLRTAYVPRDGSPIYTESDLTLAEGNGVIRQGAAPISRVR